MTTCASVAGSGSPCPRTAACSKGSSSSSTGPARERITTELALAWARHSGRRPSVHVAPAADRRAGVRPVSGHDRPRQRGPAHRPAARAPSAHHPLRLLRRGDRGVDGGRAAAATGAAGSASRDPDRAAGRHRLPPRGSCSRLDRQDVDLINGESTCAPARRASSARSRCTRARSARFAPTPPCVTLPPEPVSTGVLPLRQGTADGPRRAATRPSPRSSARSGWKAVVRGPGRARMTSGTPLPCTRCSTGTAPARTSTGGCRCCPPIWGTSTRPAPTGTSKQSPSCCSWSAQRMERLPGMLS